MESLGSVADARKALEEAKQMIEDAEKMLKGMRKSDHQKITEAAITAQKISAKASMAGRILTVFANEVRSKDNAKRLRMVRKRVIRKSKKGKKVSLKRTKKRV